MNTQHTSAPTFTKFNVPLPSHLGQNIVITLPWNITEEEARLMFRNMYGYVEVVKTEEERQQERRERELKHINWEKARFEKATKIPYSDYTEEYIYCDGYGTNEGYFSDLGELQEWWEDEYGKYSDIYQKDGEDCPELPKYVWACKKQYPFYYTAETITEGSFEELFEDACERVSSESEDELDIALEKYYKANSSIVGYVPDYSLAIML
jgi:hypothetical protein